MKDTTRLAEYGMNALLKAGADKAQCSMGLSEKHEMNVESGELNLLRTTYDTWVNLTAIKNNQKGGTSLNKTSEEAIDKAASEALEFAGASQPDDANDISEKQEPAEFSSGSAAPDLPAMYERVKSLLHETKAKYPKVTLSNVYLDFVRSTGSYVNSNGVSFKNTKGVYHCSVTFSARDGEKVSSFNYTGVSMKDLEKELLECGTLGTLLNQICDQTETRPVQGKFVGDLIITPDCFDDFIHFLTGVLSDGALISGTSIYKDSLNKAIASPLFSLHSRPVSPEISDGYNITGDGYAAQNSTIVDQGVLKSFMLSLYGSRKTGKARALNSGGAYVVDPGKDSLDDIVKSVKKGVLLARFSGGNPNQNGDFSGVAKNSYLIEDGEIKYPISESMVSGNLSETLLNITAISKERADYGFALLPWVAVSGITISGK